jgi:hypothetical protein
LEGFHGFVLVGRLKTRVFDVHLMKPFMAIAMQRRKFNYVQSPFFSKENLRMS